MSDGLDGVGDVRYTEFPSRIIGGPSGTYFIDCDVSSCQWAEFLVTNISNGAGVANIIVSGNGQNAAKASLDYSGGTTLSQLTTNPSTYLPGIAFNAVANTSVFSPMFFCETVQNSPKRVFVRI